MRQHSAMLIHHRYRAKVQTLAVPATCQFNQRHQFSRRHATHHFYRTIRPKRHPFGAIAYEHNRPPCRHAPPIASTMTTRYD